jgi:hypothetical protein
MEHGKNSLYVVNSANIKSVLLHNERRLIGRCILSFVVFLLLFTLMSETLGSENNLYVVEYGHM